MAKDTKHRAFRYEKLRMPLAWIGGTFLFLSSHSSERWFRIGIPVALLGMLLRAWASGYIERKSQKLATGGPFAHVRNPLYIGNFFIGLGIVLVVQNWITMAIFLVGFAVLYHGTVLKEERSLRQQLGEPYLRYSKEVPRYVPRPTPYAGGEKPHFQWKLLWKHRELETLLGVLLLLTGLYLWEEIVREGIFLWKEKVMAGVALALIAALVFERMFRFRS